MFLMEKLENIVLHDAELKDDDVYEEDYSSFKEVFEKRVIGSFFNIPTKLVVESDLRDLRRDYVESKPYDFYSVYFFDYVEKEFYKLIDEFIKENLDYVFNSDIEFLKKELKDKDHLIRTFINTSIPKKINEICNYEFFTRKKLLEYFKIYMEQKDEIEFFNTLE